MQYKGPQERIAPAMLCNALFADAILSYNPLFLIRYIYPGDCKRWRRASNSNTPAATDTFRLSTCPAMGIASK